MTIKHKVSYLIFCLLCQYHVMSKDYYVHPKLGRDTNTGTSKVHALKTLERASQIKLRPGDRLLLAYGERYKGSLEIINIQGTVNMPIIIKSIPWDALADSTPAIIDFKSKPNGIYIEGCSFLNISNIYLTGNGFDKNTYSNFNMRCGMLMVNSRESKTAHINLSELKVFDVFYENEGFTRDKNEVRTANGTQKYGWGIRVISKAKESTIQDIDITNCKVENVSHTGIKLTGSNKNISNINISGNTIKSTGGPGIQMSEVKDVHVWNNTVTYSGSNDDSRKWGRGSGLWTWGSSKVLIEKNKFLYANGPGDSAGAHIDFNCANILLQYNVSAYNAGGFIEILGNNYNCSYRYNLSINDGHRVKGVDGAFQEGKILWLSGYQGDKKKRKGPVNTYIYNNTIYSDASFVSKIAIDNTSQGILIANNIFYLEGGSKAVLGDQYKPETKNGEPIKNVDFQNNLFLDENSWPKEVGIQDSNPIFGNPLFENYGSLNSESYIPKNTDLVKGQGINIQLLTNDKVGLIQSLKLEKDIMGNPVFGQPSLGAIEPIKN